MIYYESLSDFPLWNWEKCTEGELQFTRINSKIGTAKTDIKFWEKLYDQYLVKFGLSKNYETILELKMQMAELQLDYCEEGNAFILNKISRIERDIEDILKRSTGGMTIDECLMYLSKWMGFRLDKKIISALEFQTYLESYQKEATKKQ